MIEIGTFESKSILAFFFLFRSWLLQNPREGLTFSSRDPLFDADFFPHQGSDFDRKNHFEGNPPISIPLFALRLPRSSKPTIVLGSRNTKSDRSALYSGRSARTYAVFWQIEVRMPIMDLNSASFVREMPDSTSSLVLPSLPPYLRSKAKPGTQGRSSLHYDRSCFPHEDGIKEWKGRALTLPSQV